MTYYNLIKLAKVKDDREPKRNVVAPLAMALGLGSLYGRSDSHGKAYDLERTIENLEEIAPKANADYQGNVDKAVGDLSDYHKDQDRLYKDHEEFLKDKRKFNRKETISHEWKKDPKYYRDTDRWFENQAIREELRGAKLEEAKNNAVKALDNHNEEIASFKKKIDDAKKLRGKALTKATALGVLGTGLIGGGLIHGLSRSKEKR